MVGAPVDGEAVGGIVLGAIVVGEALGACEGAELGVCEGDELGANVVGEAVGAVGAMVGHASPRAVPSALGWVAWVCADRLSYQFSPHSPVLSVRSLLKRAKHTAHPFQTHASHTARHAFGNLLWSRVPMERSGTYRRIDSLVWTVNSLGMVPVRELPASSLWQREQKIHLRGQIFRKQQPPMASRVRGMHWWWGAHSCLNPLTKPAKAEGMVPVSPVLDHEELLAR